MARGRKPRPLALRLADGARPKPFEPIVPPGRPVKADWLSPAASAVWDRVEPHLATLGVLSQVDELTLARYCEMYAEWQACETTTQKQYLSAHLLRFECEFGLTPSSRTRLVIPQKVRDELDEFLSRSRPGAG